VTKLVRVTTGRKRRSPTHDDGRLVKTCPRRRITTSSIVNLEIARRDVRETATRSRDAGITDRPVRPRVPENGIDSSYRRGELEAGTRSVP